MVKTPDLASAMADSPGKFPGFFIYIDFKSFL
jgi:hypothetical protein